MDTLSAVTRGRRLDLAFQDAAEGLDDRDRRWARACAFGVLRHRGRLDHVLGAHVRRGITSLEPVVLDVLRMGVHQLVHMDGVPPYAAVSQSVDQVRATAGRGAAGLVNGVLRSVGRTGLDAQAFPSRQADPAGFLSTWHSHPSWLVERWLTRWPPDEVEALAMANNAVAPVYIRPLGSTPAEAARALGGEASGARVVGPCVVVPDELGPVQALDRVRGIIQDPAAALVTLYADVPAGELVADLCAAPGGKAVALAETASYVVAADRSARRLRRLSETVRRLGSPVGVVVARAEAPPLRVAPSVLLDVPCSGTGTLRRNPDLKWRLTPEGLESLVELQRGILESGAALVPVGGLLVYATCTLEPEENEGQVEAFLKRHEGFRLEPPSIMEPTWGEAGFLEILPQRTGFDGSFAARLRRVA